jgi:hypothetical protein
LRELIKTIKALEGFWGILFDWAGVVRDIACCKGGVNKKAQQIRGEPPAIQKQRQPAKTAPVAESSNKYRQYQASKAQTINCYCAEQLLYYRTKNLQKQTLSKDRKGIATFSALNLSIFTIILCLHIVNKLLGKGGGVRLLSLNPGAAIRMRSLPA